MNGAMVHSEYHQIVKSLVYCD